MISKARNATLHESTVAANIKFASLEIDLRREQDENAGLRTNVASLLAVQTSKEAELDDARREISGKIVEVANLERQLRVLNGTVNVLEDRIKVLETERKNWAAAKLAAETETTVVRGERDALLARLERLFASGAEDEERMENLLQQLRHKTTELASLRRDLANNEVGRQCAAFTARKVIGSFSRQPLFPYKRN